ncbi:MAG TPA: prepilin-type N-terminal cleavage/methylation domain-containing protein [Candidatus Omnitrophota bacterium]|nr:prepilin-type N-terminal cleavage/methylation domain-containing protein [Candidatus Omnitrophota bacterium]
MKRGGFTLVEVMAAMVIVGVAFVSILGMYTVGIRISRQNRQKTEAYNLLTRKLEEIKPANFATNVNQAGFQYSGFPQYTLGVTQTAPFLGNPNLKRIEVGVSWNNSFGNLQAETIITLKANN